MFRTLYQAVMDSVTLQIIVKAVFFMGTLTWIFTAPDKTRKGLTGWLLRTLGMILLWLGVSRVVPQLLSYSLEQNIFWDLGILLAFYLFYPLFFYRQPGRQKIILTESMVSVCLVTNILSYSLGTVLDNLLPGHTLLFYVMESCLLVVFALLARRYSLEKYPEIMRSAVILNSVIDLFAMGMLAWTLYQNFFVSASLAYNTVIFLILYIMTAASYLACHMLSEENQKLRRISAESKMQEALNKEMEMTQGMMEHLRGLKHDLKNQYSYALTLLQAGRLAELEELLKDYSHQRVTMDYYVNCGNPELSAILTMEAEKAFREKIRLDIAAVVPEKLPCDRLDLLAILTNMIDNAIDAGVRTGIREDIQVRIEQRNGMLFLGVYNRLPEEADETRILSLATSKQNASEHGLGTGIIRRTAEKYGGYVSFTVRDHYFRAEAVLNGGREEAL